MPPGSLFFCILPVLLFLLFSSGCASRFEQFLDMVTTAEEASIRFGPPSSTAALPNGEQHSAWIMDEDETLPDEWIKKEVWIGTDRDGYPVTKTVHIFVPAHIVHHNCRLDIITDAQGQVLDKQWQGKAASCERLTWRRKREY